MKILHLGFNDQFLNTAWHLFENVYPGQNEVWIYELSFLKQKFTPAFPMKTIGYFEVLSPRVQKRLKEFDLVIIHAMSPLWVALINHAAPSVNFVWCGWGFDYYPYIYTDKTDLYLPRTKKTAEQYEKGGSVLSKLKKIPKLLLGYENDQGAFKKLRGLNTVLPSEYELLKQRGLIKHLPPYIAWNYGNLEETLLKNFQGQSVEGRDILLGNSADLTNNHADGFEILGALNLSENRRVITPLSYGAYGWLDDLLQEGDKFLPQNFTPLTDFMALDDYIKTIKSCGFAIMNHIRQQGLGTVIQLMYMGAKIFLREECPTYTFFKEQGAAVFSIQDLQQNPALLDNLLSLEEVRKNRAVLQQYWSKDVIDRKTEALVKAATA